MSNIEWKTVKEYEDITYKKCNGVARIAFNRPDVRNAFRPKTTLELYQAFMMPMKIQVLGWFYLVQKDPPLKMVSIRFVVEVIKKRVVMKAMWVMMATID